MTTATLVAENVSHFPESTNFYECSDGQWLLVTVASLDMPDTVEMFGVRLPGSKVEMVTTVAVFLSDSEQNVLDADGDPSNGLTPLATPNVATHEAALAELGYELTEV